MEAIILARCTGATLALATRFAAPPTDAMQRYGVDRPIRQAMFLANVGHESGSLQHTTGRANHAAVRDRLRRRFPQMAVPDFEVQPQALALPAWAALSAVDYVDMRGLSGWADKGDFDGYCDLINRGRKTIAKGDSNGWVERVRLYAAARRTLGLA